MAEIKGIILNSWMNFLIERYGKKTVTEALQSLNPEEQKMVPTKFLAYEWYPYNTIFAVGKITWQLGNKEERIFFKLGRFIANHLFTHTYRILLVKDPIKQIEKFAWIEEFFYKRTRTLEAEFLSNTKCLLRRSYLAGATSSVNNCESVIGFWTETLELSGADNVRIAHPKCVVNKADCCEFVIEWDLPNPTK